VRSKAASDISIVRIIATADLHYEFHDESRRDTARLAQEVTRLRPDVFLIAGDTFAHDPAILRQCLSLFDPLECPRMLVAGNHDLWTSDGDSLQIYEQTIPRVAAECGFHYLDAEPLVLHGVGFVGNMGWYDYSFREDSLGVPMRFYAAKIGPGAALGLGWMRLLDKRDDLTPEVLRISTAWQDGFQVHWKYDDCGFTDVVVRRLEEHLSRVENEVKAIVCLTHHIPFANMVTRKKHRDWAFGNAFMGSERMGQVMLRHPKVRWAVFGHSHTTGRAHNGPIECINVGSTYRKKRFVEVEVG